VARTGSHKSRGIHIYTSLLVMESVEFDDRTYNLTQVD